MTYNGICVNPTLTTSIIDVIPNTFQGIKQQLQEIEKSKSSLKEDQSSVLDMIPDGFDIFDAVKAIQSSKTDAASTGCICEENLIATETNDCFLHFNQLIPTKNTYIALFDSCEKFLV